MVRDGEGLVYSHASEPRPIKRQKYRELGVNLPRNLMNDPRVARGSTTKPNSRHPSDNSLHRSSKFKPRQPKKASTQDDDLINARKPLLLDKQKKESDELEIIKAPRGIFSFTPTISFQPELNLSQFLEEGTPEIVERHMVTQTDEFNDRAPSPEYIPKKVGIDASTQIEPEDNLFDFDMEVIPLLEVLVSKTLDQSLEEVEQEEELEAIRKATKEFEEEKRREKDEMNELERKTNLKWIQKEKKLKEARKERMLQRQLQKKVASISFAKQIVPLSLSQIYEKKKKDPEWDGEDLELKKDLSESFLPWLFDSVGTRVNEIYEVERTLDDIIKYSRQRRIDLYNEIQEGKRLRKQREEEEAKEAERLRLLALEAESKEDDEDRIEEEEAFVRVLIPKGTLGVSEDVVIGPLRITNQDTVMDVESAIFDWILQHDVVPVDVLPSQGIRVSNEGEILDRSRILMNDEINEETVIHVEV